MFDCVLNVTVIFNHEINLEKNLKIEGIFLAAQVVKILFLLTMVLFGFKILSERF